jgi:hypothetical protein
VAREPEFSMRRLAWMLVLVSWRPGYAGLVLTGAVVPAL